MLLGGNSEEKGGYTDGDPPLGVSNLSHILGAPGMESNSEKMSPLDCLEGCWD